MESFVVTQKKEAAFTALRQGRKCPENRIMVLFGGLTEQDVQVDLIFLLSEEYHNGIRSLKITFFLIGEDCFGTFS